MQPSKYQPLHEHFRQIQSRGLKVEAYDVLNALFEAEVHIKGLESLAESLKARLYGDRPDPAMEVVASSYDWMNDAFRRDK